MTVNDKDGVLSRLASMPQVKIELGCGPNKRHADAIGIDMLDYPGVNVIGDIYDVLSRFPSGSVKEVYSYHFVEHVENVDMLLLELARVVCIGGKVEFVAPHFSNPHFYSDPTHRSFFGLYTFCYFANDTPFVRKVPTYQRELFFEVERVDLRFKSFRPFYLRHSIKNVVGRLINSCNYLKELYEENFCYIFPCAEVQYRLRRTVKPKQRE